MGGPNAYNQAMQSSLMNRYNTMAFPTAGGDISGQTGLGQFANWLSGRLGGTGVPPVYETLNEPAADDYQRIFYNNGNSVNGKEVLY